MKKVKLIFCLALLVFFIAGMLTSCAAGTRFTCPTYAKGATKTNGRSL